MQKNSIALSALALTLLCMIFSHTPAFGQTGRAQGMKVKLTAGGQVLTATFDDNATSRALVARFPLLLPMMNLYAREMCYRFPEGLPAQEAGTSGYEVGDIAYWTPRHSLVIFYKQNGEVIDNLQKIGRLDSGVDIFEKSGDVSVMFELVK